VVARQSFESHKARWRLRRALADGSAFVHLIEHCHVRHRRAVARGQAVHRPQRALAGKTCVEPRDAQDIRQTPHALAILHQKFGLTELSRTTAASR